MYTQKPETRKPMIFSSIYTKNELKEMRKVGGPLGVNFEIIGCPLSTYEELGESPEGDRVIQWKKVVPVGSRRVKVSADSRRSLEELNRIIELRQQARREARARRFLHYPTVGTTAVEKDFKKILSGLFNEQ